MYNELKELLQQTLQEALKPIQQELHKLEIFDKETVVLLFKKPKSFAPSTFFCKIIHCSLSPLRNQSFLFSPKNRAPVASYIFLI